MNGHTLKRLRISKDMSLQALADATGICRQAISSIETGDADPKASTLEALAKALGVQTSVFFDNNVTSTEQSA